MVLEFLKLGEFFFKLADFDNFRGHFGVLRLDLDHEFLIAY